MNEQEHQELFAAMKVPHGEGESSAVPLKIHMMGLRESWLDESGVEVETKFCDIPLIDQRPT